jgi:hypothetical protein
MTFQDMWYRNLYPDIKSAGVDPSAHFYNFGLAENRIYDPISYLNEDFLAKRLVLTLYSLYLIIDRYSNYIFFKRLLVKLISYLQYLKIRSLSIDLVVVKSWLEGGVKEACQIYEEEIYKKNSIFELNGLRNAFNNSESPMIYKYKHLNNYVKESLLFFPMSTLEFFSTQKRIKCVHIHHCFGIEFNFNLLLKFNKEVKLYYFLHDYYIFSSLPHLYIETLQRRLSLDDAIGLYPNQLLEIKTILSRINLFITPSLNMKYNIQTLFPIDTILTLYPPETSNIENIAVKNIEVKETYNVLILGNLGNYKGESILRDLLDENEKQNLSFKFFHVGSSNSKISSKYYTNFLGLERKSIYDFVSRLEIDFAWLPFQCEESYSFTLSDIFLLGLPLISYSIGAIPERCYKRENTILVNESDNEVTNVLNYFQLLTSSYSIKNEHYPSQFGQNEIQSIYALRNRNKHDYSVLH